MKTFTTTLLLLLAVKAHSQQFYISAGGGYNVPAIKQTLSVYSTDGKLNNFNGSFGKGYNAMIGGGYFFNEHIAAEINFSHLISTQDYFSSEDESQHSSEATMTRIIPSIKLITGKKIRPYICFGFVAGIAPSLKTDFNELIGPSGEFVELHEKYKGGNAFGFSNTIGTEFILKENLFIFFQLNAILQNWGPDEVEYTAISHYRSYDYSSSGTDHLEDSVSDPDDSRLRKYFPFNRIGLQAGITWYFRQKNKPVAGATSQ
ncbi:MAG: outer membrane beta-barrel protein [Bacteroidota bacterium]